MMVKDLITNLGLVLAEVHQAGCYKAIVLADESSRLLANDRVREAYLGE